MKLLRFLPPLVSVVVAARVAGQPIPAATPEGILCAGTYIAVGRVLEATNTDCRIKMVEGCSPDNVIDLRVEVTEVMGARQPSPSHPVGRSLRRGDVISVRTHAFASLVITSIPPPPRPALSDRQIHGTFVDKEFIFSVMMMDHHVTHHSAFPASLWPLSERTWALDTMVSDPGANCPQRW